MASCAWCRSGTETRVSKGEEEAPVSAEENEALVRRYFEEGWVKRNLAAVDDFMVPNYIEHQIPDGQLTSRHSLKQLLTMYYKAFPNMKSVLHDILAQGDRVMYRWSVNATHLGDWLGIPPTGNHMRATGITIYRIVGGKAVEGWSSVAISRSEEEQRWLSEGGITDEASPEGGDVPLPGLDLERSPAFDSLIRNLTWRFRAAEARERERIEQELRVARRIQQELLPEATPELDGWQIAVYYGPAREVGGDFYDFLEFPDGRLGLVVGDATGHGMPAALVMATTRGMLRAVVQSLELPGEVLARVNEALVADIPSSMFVTCFYSVCLLEAHNLQLEMFGFARLRKLVADHDAEEGSMVDFLMEELYSFVGEDWEQEDDITLLTLRRSASLS